MAFCRYHLGIPVSLTLFSAIDMSGQQVISLKASLLVWLALLISLLISWGTAYALSGPLGDAISMLMAVTQVLLILAFYMHLKYTSHVNKLVATASLFWVLVILGLIIGDYVTRSDHVLTEKHFFIHPDVGA